MPHWAGLAAAHYGIWNSEVGSKTLGIASFFLRAVCMNRNIWVRRGGAIN